VKRLGSALVNFYAAEENGRWTLLDAGVPGFWPQLEANGIGPDAIDAVVLTHAHGDHVGVAERLRQAGARVYVHEADRGLATTAKPSGKNERSSLPYLRHAAAWKLMTHLARNGGLKPQPIGEVTTFADGEQLDVPGRPRVIHTPGHTDGHCVFTVDGALVVGDLLCTLDPLTGARGPRLLPRALNRSTPGVVESLAKIEGLDVETVHFGHGEPWTRGVRDLVAAARVGGAS
jgi:glyoxylase-like metal-dependent hydrolase (beta-lactamase superfamily II)